MMNIENKKSNRSKIPSRNQLGFTLVELAIVLIIIGILVTPLIGLYSAYVSELNRERTKNAIEEATNALISYYSNTGSYPCPSDLSKGLNDANFGVEYCGTSSFAAISLAIPLNTCISGGGLCRVAGTRDEDGDGNNDPILIGGIPFASLTDRLESPLGPDILGKDGWNGMLMYAISQNLTEASHPILDRFLQGTTNDFEYGVITVVDEFGNNTAGTTGDAQFVVFSLGPDQVAAWNMGGIQTSACAPATVEGENCDADGTFVSSISSYDSPAQRYDDVMHASKIPSGELWAYILNTGANTTTGSIKNLNTGNVGVKTNAPQTLLDVNGDIKTPSVLANTLCKPNGATAKGCLPIDFLWNGTWSSPTSVTTPSGTTTFQNRCPNSTDAISWISDGKVVCTNVAVPSAPVGPIQCDSGFYMTGISTNGCLYCSGGTSPKC